MDALVGLNDDQKKAVCSTEGYVRVVAGAGTGKTKALTHRYAYLVSELGISPTNILCLTFTNKAAGEMKRRIKALLGADTDVSLVSTIHGFCARILREDIEKLFYPSEFPILDSDDGKKLLEQIYEEEGMRLDSASFQSMLDKIEIYKTDHTEYISWLADPDFDFSTLLPATLEERVIMKYIEKQKKSYAIDFPDLIKFVTYIFDYFPEVERKWQKRLFYIEVDEFQDVDIEQYRFVTRLAAIYHNLFVVGDPDQNIYTWRGSGNRFILNFDKDNQPCTSLIMNRNYRSTPQILNAANSLVSVNHDRIKKDLYTRLSDGDLPEYFHAKNEEREMSRILSFVRQRAEEGGRYSDIALLYRASYLSRSVEQLFIENKIPYTVVGGVGFYERAEIKNMIAYMRTVLYGDDLSFLRVVNTPRRGVGKLRLEKIKSLAQRDKLSLFEAARVHVNDPELSGCRLRDFVALIEKMRAVADDMSVSDLLQKLFFESGYESYIRKSGDLERLDNVSELIRSINQTDADFGEKLTLSTFLQNVALFRDTDDNSDADRVRLMTVHAAKGLEFENVILIGMSENIFPSARSVAERSDKALEEERRLAFVAMTRAKRRLLITDSEGIGVKGAVKLPSRFVTEDIDRSLITLTGDKLPDDRKTSEHAPAKGSSEARFSAGDRLLHKHLGIGTVDSVDNELSVYFVKFSVGLRPISFDFDGLVKI